VVIGDDLGQPKAKLWACEAGAMPSRTPGGLAVALSAMLTNCREIHLVDPHFGPENDRHRKVLEALVNVLVVHALCPDLIRVHCSAKSDPRFFEQEVAKMSDRLPVGFQVDFVRWNQKQGGEKLHNRYVLTDLGGVSLGVGLDEGEPGESDDLLLLPRPQYEHRWSQYVGNAGAFDLANPPVAVRGTRIPRSASVQRGRI
jgi:hypothetical protein